MAIASSLADNTLAKSEELVDNILFTFHIVCLVSRFSKRQPQSRLTATWFMVEVNFSMGLQSN